MMGGFEVEWNEPDPATLDELTHWACFAADEAVIGSAGRTSRVRNPDGSAQGLTGAEVTEVAVRAGLRMLLANGIITANLDQDAARAYALDAPPEART